MLLFFNRAKYSKVMAIDIVKFLIKKSKIDCRIANFRLTIAQPDWSNIFVGYNHYV